MSCRYETKNCRNYMHCQTCSYYEIGNLTATAMATEDDIGTSVTRLPSAKEYREAVNKIAFQFTTQWSEPKYQCPKCGGGMCKNLMVTLTTYPAQYEYQCDKCGYIEYQFG